MSIDCQYFRSWQHLLMRCIGIFAGNLDDLVLDHLINLWQSITIVSPSKWSLLFYTHFELLPKCLFQWHLYFLWYLSTLPSPLYQSQMSALKTTNQFYNFFSRYGKSTQILLLILNYVELFLCMPSRHTYYWWYAGKADELLIQLWMR